MKQRNDRTERFGYTMNSRPQKMPFQTKHEIMPNGLMAAKSALPFFGGTSPDAPGANGSAEPKEDEKPAGSTGAAAPADNSGGGDGTSLTPEQIAAIVASNAQLQEQLKETNKKVEGYTKAEADAEKAKLGDIERRDREIAERDETIVSMDRVIRSLAVENAINNAKDVKFHSAKHVINELDPTAYEIDVDLKTGTATISNIDKELKRISDANPWMVVDAAKDNPGNGSSSKQGNQNPGGGNRRGSGAPPNPAASRQSDATQRRTDLMKRFPVIAKAGQR